MKRAEISVRTARRKSKMAVIMVSACLLGCSCRYDGKNCKNDAVLSLAEDNVLVGICPEQMGGLPTPRDPAEIRGGKVVSKSGRDVTSEYTKGAQTALQLALLNGAKYAVLKSKSPSCGKGIIYDGTFSGGKVEGNGVSAELFMQDGIDVFTEEELDRLADILKK